jgi:hypothetical protein
MSRCKLSFAKSRFVVDPARGTGAAEIPRNEAYSEHVEQQMGVFRQPQKVNERGGPSSSLDHLTRDSV